MLKHLIGTKDRSIGKCSSTSTGSESTSDFRTLVLTYFPLSSALQLVSTSKPWSIGLSWFLVHIRKTQRSVDVASSEVNMSNIHEHVPGQSQPNLPISSRKVDVEVGHGNRPSTSAAVSSDRIFMKLNWYGLQLILHELSYIVETQFYHSRRLMSVQRLLDIIFGLCVLWPPTFFEMSSSIPRASRRLVHRTVDFPLSWLHM